MEKNQIKSNQLYTTQEIANNLGVDRKTVQRAIKSIFPDSIKNGYKTILTEPQAIRIINSIKSKNNIEISAPQPRQNDEVAKFPAQIAENDIIEVSHAVIKAHGIIKTLCEKIAQDRPKVDFYNNYLSADQYYSMGEAARILGTGRTRLFKKLRAAEIFNKKGIPYQEFMRYFKIVPVPIKGGAEYVNSPKISAAGIEYLQKKFFKKPSNPEQLQLIS